MPRQRLPGGAGWKDLGPGSAAGDGIGSASPIAVALAPDRERPAPGPVTVRQGTPGDAMVPCPDCSYRFVSEDALRRHRAFKHPEPVLVGREVAEAMDRALSDAPPTEQPSSDDSSAVAPQLEPSGGVAAMTAALFRQPQIAPEHIRFMLKLLLGEAVLRSAMAEGDIDIDDALVRVLEDGGFSLYLVPPGVSPSLVPPLGTQR